MSPVSASTSSRAAYWQTHHFLDVRLMLSALEQNCSMWRFPLGVRFYGGIHKEGIT